MGSGGLIRALMAVNTGTKEGEMDRAQREATLAQYAEQRAVEQAQLEKTQKETSALPGTWEDKMKQFTAPAETRAGAQEYGADQRLAGVKFSDMSKDQQNALTQAVRKQIADEDAATKVKVQGMKAPGPRGPKPLTPYQSTQEALSFNKTNGDLKKFADSYRELKVQLADAANKPAAVKGAYLKFMGSQMGGLRMSRYLEQQAMQAGDQSVVGRLTNGLTKLSTGVADPTQLAGMQGVIDDIANVKRGEFKDAVSSAVRAGIPAEHLPQESEWFGSDAPMKQPQTPVSNAAGVQSLFSPSPSAAPPPATPPAPGLTAPRPGGPPKQNQYSPDNPFATAGAQ